MTTKTKVVWNGPAALRRMLVPIDELEETPGNPRRGNVPVLRSSLRRFGQVRPVVVVEGRILAGHHLVQAARAEGWTRIAAVEAGIEDEVERQAYLAADNRTSDLATYDDRELAALLGRLSEHDALEGTGYTADDHDAILAQLYATAGDGAGPLPGAPPRLGSSVGDRAEVVLIFNRDQRDQLELWLAAVSKEVGADGISEAVYEAARIAAEALA